MDIKEISITLMQEYPLINDKAMSDGSKRSTLSLHWFEEDYDGVFR